MPGEGGGDITKCMGQGTEHDIEIGFHPKLKSEPFGLVNQ